MYNFFSAQAGGCAQSLKNPSPSLVHQADSGCTRPSTQVILSCSFTLHILIARDSSILRWLSSIAHLSRIVRKPDFCLCKNKGADQLRSNREADQRLCFRYTSTLINFLDHWVITHPFFIQLGI